MRDKERKEAEERAKQKAAAAKYKKDLGGMDSFLKGLYGETSKAVVEDDESDLEPIDKNDKFDFGNNEAIL